MTGGEASAIIFAKAVSSVAGRLAEKRALRGSEPGWVRMVSPQRIIALHEAGHAVTAAAVGLFVHRVSIIPDGVSAGRCTSSSHAELGEVQKPTLRDRSQAALYACALTLNAPCPRWKAMLGTIRLLRKTATEILERNWLLVMVLASELERRKELDQAQIENLLRGKIAA